MDFVGTGNILEKQYILFNKAIHDNDRICIMHLEHGETTDLLSEVKITKE